LPPDIQFIDEKKLSEYNSLIRGKFEERTLFALINRKLDTLERNVTSGKQISRSKIPRQYQDFDNLWKINLNSRWRLLYSIVTDDQGQITVIIDWMDHKEYDKLFGYHVS